MTFDFYIRAPLSVVQTDDWDCSFALPWDPIYADCAVPQVNDASVFYCMKCAVPEFSLTWLSMCFRSLIQMLFISI